MAVIKGAELSQLAYPYGMFKAATLANVERAELMLLLTVFRSLMGTVGEVSPLGKVPQMALSALPDGLLPMLVACVMHEKIRCESAASCLVFLDVQCCCMWLRRC